MTIRSSAENTWLLENILSAPSSTGIAYIGLYKTGTTWAWSSGESVAFTAWLPGRPDNFGGNQNFVHLTTGNRLWDDVGDASTCICGPYVTEAIVEY